MIYLFQTGLEILPGGSSRALSHVVGFWIPCFRRRYSGSPENVFHPSLFWVIPGRCIKSSPLCFFWVVPRIINHSSRIAFAFSGGLFLFPQVGLFGGDIFWLVLLVLVPYRILNPLQILPSPSNFEPPISIYIHEVSQKRSFLISPSKIFNVLDPPSPMSLLRPSRVERPHKCLD